MRRTPNKTAGLLGLTTALTLGAGAILAAPAVADLTTTCRGTGGAVTVPGDLIVPADASCSLDGTIVQGDVIVRAGADLLADGAQLGGDVRVQAGGYLDLWDSSVAGAIVARDGFGVSLTGSTVTGAVTASSSGAGTPFLIADTSTLTGAVRSTSGGGVELYSSTALRQVTSTNSEYTDVIDTVVEDTLTVTGAVNGSLTCASEVYGSATLRGNAGVQVGGVGPDITCDGGSYWGKDLTVSNNTVSTLVSDNIVRGNLSGTGNSPAPVGQANRVRGVASGQFTDLTPAATSRRPAVLDSSGTRDSLRAEVEVRRQDAQSEARLAGSADL